MRPQASLARLAALADQRDQTALYRALDEIGVETALDDLFEELGGRFDPARARGQAGTLQWNLATPGGVRSRQLVIENDRCRAQRGGATPSVVLYALVPDFLRIATGRVSAMQAYMARTITASGDLLFARRADGWFPPP